MALEFQLPGSNHTLVSLDKASSTHVKIPTRSKPGSVVGVCSRTAGLMSVAVATFTRCGSQRRKVRRTPGTDTADGLRDRTSDVKEEAPMSRLGHVLAKFRQRRRRLDGQEAKEVPWKHHPEGEPVVDMSSHGFPSMYGLQEFGTNWAQESRPHELPRPGMEGRLHGPVPAHTPSVGKAEWDTNLVGHYRPDDASYPASVPPFENTNGMPSMPAPTVPHHSDRQVRRFDVPSPLIIVPPPTTSISIARSHSDTISTATYTPYSPYDYYEPYVDSPVPSLSPNDDTAPSFTYGPRSTQSSGSNRSSPQPRSPISLQSTGPAPSTSRSASSDQTEPRFQLPPTPTYLQSQRAPIDSDNIICLGPLPDNISPKHLQFQPQKPRPSAPMTTTPDEKKYHHHHHHNNNNSPSTTRARAAKSTRRRPARHDPPPYDPSPPRRRSTDSLGSNFTVEEEARIQAQVVRNLSMLGQERVGGEGDIVHIPQPSARRFSFEDDR